MKQRLLLSLFALLTTIVVQADVTINATNFPDGNFRNYLLSQSYGVDGVLTSTELASIKYMDVSCRNIKSLKGIEHFKSLRELDCYQNQIKGTAMDVLVSGLPTVSGGIMNVIYNENEGNVMTTTQVATAKAKGWTPMYLDNNWNWSAYLGIVTIDATTFPDENFRNYLLSQNYGADGILTDAEIAGITSINVGGSPYGSTYNIKSLKGIEYLTALTSLICGYNQLTTLDVSKNTKLTSLSCHGNQLTTLDVSKNTKLTSLHCGSNQLTTLDVSKNTALINLGCHYNQLTTLDVSKNIALTNLTCNSNQLTTLDVSKNTALTELYCQSNKLSRLNVSNTKLTLLYCYQNQIYDGAMDALVTSLPMVSNGKMYALTDDNEQNVMTTSQVATAMPKGWTPYLGIYVEEYISYYNWVEYAGSKPTGIDIDATNFPDANFRNWVLSQSYGADEVLTTAEIAAVTSIDVSSKNIQSLKGIEFFTALKTLYCSKNQLTVLDVSKNTALTELNCNGNRLMNPRSQEIILWEGNQVIEWNADLCKITAKQMADVPVGTEIKVYYTIFEAEYNVMRIMTPWWGDSPDDNLVNQFDLTAKTPNPFKFTYNQHRKALVEERGAMCLVGYGYSVQKVTYSKMTDEMEPALNVSGCIALNSLDCSDNQLTSLDVSGCTALTKLYCQKNQIKGEDMDALIANLPVVSSGGMCVIYNENEGNEMTTTQVAAAKAKGWRPLFYNGNDWLAYAGSNPNAYVVINEQTFPDANFRYWLVCQEYGIDERLTEEEISSVNIISVYGEHIQNLKGIEYFTALKYLDCSDNQLTALDLSKNTALTELNCDYNQLMALDVSGCTALTHLSCVKNQIKGAGMDALVASLPVVGSGGLYVIYKENEGNVMTTSQVTAAKAKGWIPYYYNGDDWLTYAGSNPNANVEINKQTFPDANFRNWVLSQSYGKDGKLTEEEIALVESISLYSKSIQSLKGIEYFTALTSLSCSDNQLTALDVSNNTALECLSCYNNRLTTLDVSSNTALEDLSCYNNRLMVLDVSSNTALKYLYCHKNQLTALDVSNNTMLKYLYCDNNQLTALDVSGCTALTTLYCYNNQMTALDVSGCTALTRLNCNNNQINGVGMDVLVASLPAVGRGEMYVIYDENEGNEMTTTQVAVAKAKGWIPYYFDSVNWSWKEYAGSEPEPDGIAIDATNFPDANFRNYILNQEYGKDGVLTEEEISSVNFIRVYYERIQNLKGIEYFTALTELDCDDNQLTALDVSKNTALTKLDCGNNQLTALNVSNNTVLTLLDCHSNQLTSLDLSNNTSLIGLACGSNQLTSLDLSNNTSLIGLACGSNQLTSLDLSKNTALIGLDCYSNRINGSGMDAFVASLPSGSGCEMFVIYNENEGNEMTVDQVDAAKAKGWIPYYYDSTLKKWMEYEGDPDGIEEIKNEELRMKNNDEWYDLSGHKLDKPQKGINIVNGKKVVIK